VHPKWRVVARHAEVPLTAVHSVVGLLLECANKGKPRGSISDFSVLETAVALDIDPGGLLRAPEMAGCCAPRRGALTAVHSVVGLLLECANKGKPRGSISDFSVLESPSRAR
jgi:hypothetical protein